MWTKLSNFKYFYQSKLTFDLMEIFFYIIDIALDGCQVNWENGNEGGDKNLRNAFIELSRYEYSLYKYDLIVCRLKIGKK